MRSNVLGFPRNLQQASQKESGWLAELLLRQRNRKAAQKLAMEADRQFLDAVHDALVGGQFAKVDPQDPRMPEILAVIEEYRELGAQKLSLAADTIHRLKAWSATGTAIVAAVVFT
jgi:hypothetical protein